MGNSVSSTNDIDIAVRRGISDVHLRPETPALLEPTAVELIDRICVIAKSGTIDQLRDLVATVCIDVSFESEVAVERLAKQGEFEACRLLLREGASYSLAARGAAQGGHRDYAEALRTEHGASVNDIARGAVRGGHLDYAEWLADIPNANNTHANRPIDRENTELQTTAITKLIVELSKIDKTRVERILNAMPKSFECPITLMPLRDPIVLADGHTYEREAAIRWIADNDSSPLNGNKLAHKNISPNLFLSNQMTEHLQQEFDAQNNPK